MMGDIPDIAARIRATLPTRWFPDEAPVLDTLLSGLAAAWSQMYNLLAAVRTQSRIGTATGAVLDTIGQDFFAQRLLRRPAEPDTGYRQRLTSALRREHATRGALRSVLLDLTGREPGIFEPARPTDTGAYGGPALGYGVAGAWGSLSLPFQVFIVVHRPPTPGIATVAGYGTAGPLARASLAEAGAVVADADIYAAVTSVLPTAAIAWTRITN